MTAALLTSPFLALTLLSGKVVFDLIKAGI